jgi:hypothetical protein
MIARHHLQRRSGSTRRTPTPDPLITIRVWAGSATGLLPPVATNPLILLRVTLPPCHRAPTHVYRSQFHTCMRESGGTVTRWHLQNPIKYTLDTKGDLDFYSVPGLPPVCYRRWHDPSALATPKPDFSLFERVKTADFRARNLIFLLGEGGAGTR